MKALHMVSFVLVVVGALNWGLVGLMDYNLVESLLGAGSGVTQLVYVLVGAGALYLVLTHKNDCKVCSGK